MSQENPVNWVPDKLASLKKNPGLRSQLDLDRTQDDETVSRDRDWMGNNSSWIWGPRNTVLNDERGPQERTKIHNLKEEAALTEEPTRVSRKYYRIGILKVDNKLLRMKDRTPWTSVFLMTTPADILPVSAPNHFCSNS